MLSPVTSEKSPLSAKQIMPFQSDPIIQGKCRGGLSGAGFQWKQRSDSADHCGRFIVGRFGLSVGRCGGAAAGEPWFALGCEGGSATSGSVDGGWSKGVGVAAAVGGLGHLLCSYLLRSVISLGTSRCQLTLILLIV